MSYPTAYRNGAGNGAGGGGGFLAPIPAGGEGLSGLGEAPGRQLPSPQGLGGTALSGGIRLALALLRRDPRFRLLADAGQLGFQLWRLHQATGLKTETKTGFFLPWNWTWYSADCNPPWVPLCDFIVAAGSTICGQTHGSCDGLNSPAVTADSPFAQRRRSNRATGTGLYAEHWGPSWQRIAPGTDVPRFYQYPDLIPGRIDLWPDGVPNVPDVQPVSAPMVQPPAAVPYRLLPAWRRVSPWREVGPRPEPGAQREGDGRVGGRNMPAFMRAPTAAEAGSPEKGLPPGFTNPPAVPPGPNVRERKFRQLQGLLRVAGAGTEALDFIGCIHKALPKSKRKPILGRRLHGKTYMPSDGPAYKRAIQMGARPVNQTPQQMLKEIYGGWNEINWPQANSCIHENEGQDAAIGRPQKAFNEALGGGHGRSLGDISGIARG